MLLILNGKITFEYQYCQQCGSCLAVCPTKSLSAKRLKNGLVDIQIDQDTCIKCKKCIKSCPAAIGDQIEEYNRDFPKKKYYFARSNDADIRYLSSSGGTCKTLIIQALKQGLIDGVYTLCKTNKYPYAEGMFYSKENIPSHDDIPNSVYHSVMLNANIELIPKCKRLMVVGTNCQIKGMEVLLKHKCDTLIKVCIFCKQQKTLDSTRFWAKMMGVKINIDNYFDFQYRGNGWPGIVKLNQGKLPYARASILPFGKRIWTVPGCNICGDTFSQYHADLSLMDPWGGINAGDVQGSNLVVVHTTVGCEILNAVENLELIKKSYSEVIPGLSLKDINRKQQMIPYFQGKKCSARIKIAGILEIFQRNFFIFVLQLLPKMPIIMYRIIHKIPDLRNIILR